MKHETVSITPDERSERTSSRKRTKHLGKFAAGDRQRAPEAHQLHGPQKAPEHIGHMLIDAESRDRLEQAPRQYTGQRVGTLNRAELFHMSDSILVDGNSLRQIYESHLIGERGLRRLVAEYLRSGDLRKALRQEVVEREIDFERDPVLRDMAPAEHQQAVAAGNTVALNKLLENVEIEGADGSEEAAFFKARAHYEVLQLQQHKKQRRAIDASIAITIVILIALVIGLALTRK